LEAVLLYREELQKSEIALKSTVDAKKQAVDNVWNELQHLGIHDNKHTTHTIDSIGILLAQLQDESLKRQQAYEAELARQKNFEEKRKEFAAQGKREFCLFNRLSKPRPSSTLFPNKMTSLNKYRREKVRWKVELPIFGSSIMTVRVAKSTFNNSLL
jgi:hypothetical protein